MLKELYIRNMAVIDELRLEFNSGFQVLTGETGAGKSILVEAIGLILGQKADKTLIRDGSDESIVEAVFDLSETPDVRNLLTHESLGNPDDESELIIRRHINAAGKNRIFVNSQRANLSQLQLLSSHLIDFTGQHEQISLLESENDITILDSFIQDRSLLEQYGKQYSITKALSDEIQKLHKLKIQKEQRLEWLKFQLKEFSDLKIHSVEEEEELKKQRSHLKNHKLIAEFSNQASELLGEGDVNALQSLKLLRDRIERSDILSGLYGKFIGTVNSTIASIEDLSYEIARVTEHAAGDTNLDADEIESRLHQLEKLKRKFGPEVEDVLRHKSEMEEEILTLQNSDARIEELNNQFFKHLNSLKSSAKSLSKQRSLQKLDLEKSIQKELKFLLMPEVKFIVDVKSHADDCLNDMSAFSETGIDLVQFLLSPNPGLAPRPLARIASGGETSRIFLALKQVLAQSRRSGTLIFDEIDTGISGAAVELVGQKLKMLSRNFQVFCVTHHAQIASQADQHYFVHKSSEKKKTITRVRTLNREERIQEIARLMGGVEITDKNLAFAKELLKH